MTAGEIRRPEADSPSEAGELAVGRAWGAMGDAQGASPFRTPRTNAFADSLTALLETDSSLPELVRDNIRGLLRDYRLLEGECQRQRALLQEWILSQQTYKALYYQYSGQSDAAPRIDLMNEKEQMRRSILKELQGGGEHTVAIRPQALSLSEL